MGTSACSVILVGRDLVVSRIKISEAIESMTLYQTDCLLGMDKRIFFKPLLFMFII